MLFERGTFCFSSYKNPELKVMRWSSQKKKECIFVTFILSEGYFLTLFLFYLNVKGIE